MGGQRVPNHNDYENADDDVNDNEDENNLRVPTGAERTSPTTTQIFAPAPDDHSNGRKLSGTLKPRHLSMIALGGVIGAGLLVASSSAILAAGPAVLVSYVLAGVIVVLVMRMLGEMASAHPETGSFSVYAGRFIGPWAGLSVGWMYWWFWVVVVGIEATAAAQIVVGWLPMVPQWVWALAFTLTFIVVNLASVKSFGEFEFWFASTKVIAIGLFVVFGALLILGIIPSAHVGFDPSNYGGWMPNGFSGIVAALLPIAFSMFGAEVATIAAGESERPQVAVRKAVNSILIRILLFYIGSMIVIVLLIPWNEVVAGKSPFASALERTGIPYVGVIMDIVVLSALLSTLNASLYTASRMAYSLAGRGQAPRILRRVGAGGTPYMAILASSIIGLVTVILNYTVPDYVFAFLVNSTGATALFVWLIVAVSQLRSRKLMPGVINRPGVIRMWGFPIFTWLVIGALSALLLYMLFGPNSQTRTEVIVSLCVTSLAIICGIIVQRSTKTAGACQQQSD